MRRVVILVAFAALAVPGPARAGEQTLVFTSQPITIGPYGVARDLQGPVPSPNEDGYVVGMTAEVVDLSGNPVPMANVMLHHVAFVKVLAREYTCSTFAGFDGRPFPIPIQRFYAEGEERYGLALPAGYGYANRGADLWGLVYMLMNHHAHTSTIAVRYTVRYVTREALVAVTPVWLDVRNCQSDPIFNVPGTGGRGSTTSVSADFRMPESGRFVAGGAHLHGGGRQVAVSDVTCGTRLYTSYPTWGLMEPTPAMHEPGPMSMTHFAEPAGRAVRAGDVLRITATYDNAAPHVRVMGISMLYFAPGPAGACASVTDPPPPPTAQDRIAIPLLKQPAGAWRRVTSTWVGDYAFGAQRVTIRRGTTFTWRFVGRAQHDVTLASGPEGFASPGLAGGTFRFRFKRPGTYKLFCSLHPSRMTQVVVVR